MDPTTTLDARFSDPAVAVSWDKTRMLLEAAELFWVCTVRPGGRPHVTPLCRGVGRRGGLLPHGHPMSRSSPT